MLPIILIISVGIGVTALIGGVAIALRREDDMVAEPGSEILELVV